MAGRLEGRVAFITGVARGQGRAHAVRLAAEGADIIGLDLAGPLPEAVPYDPATPEDLEETRRLVEEQGRRALLSVGDVRDLDGMKKIVDDGVAELGRLDVVVANAGICTPQIWDTIAPEDFAATIDTNVTGVWNTVMATAHHVIAAGGVGSALAAATKSRAVSVAAGLSLLAGSACTRFGVLNAGLEAVKNPETTIGPQKRRAERRRREQGLDHDVVSPD